MAKRKKEPELWERAETELAPRLKELEPVEMIVSVREGGINTSPIGPLGRANTLRISVEKFRIAGGPVREQPIVLAKGTGFVEGDSIGKTIDGALLLRVTARIDEGAIASHAWGLLETVEEGNPIDDLLEPRISEAKRRWDEMESRSRNVGAEHEAQLRAEFAGWREGELEDVAILVEESHRPAEEGYAADVGLARLGTAKAFVCGSGEVERSGAGLACDPKRSDVGDAISTLGDGSIADVRARVVRGSRYGRPVLIIDALVARESANSALRAVRDLVGSIDRVEHAQFGTLTWDRDHEYFECSADWCGSEVTVWISSDSPDDPEDDLAFAERLWARAEEWDRQARDLVVREVLERFNAWAREDAELEGLDFTELTAEQIRAALSPSMLQIDPRVAGVSGAIEVQLDFDLELEEDDFDYLGGHSLEACGSVENGPETVMMQG